MSRIELLPPAELATALGYLLAVPGTGRRAGSEEAGSFVRYIDHARLEWMGLRVGPARAPAALFVALLLPGGTAIVLVPSPGELGIREAAQRTIIRAGLEQLADRRLHYVQALLPPLAEGQRKLLSEHGFGLLAPLVYLERAVAYPWADPPAADEAEWVRYGAATHAAFAATLLETYQDSLDCPELTNLRPIEDVLAGHQASGVFDPDYWELACIGGRPAGCLLLARLPDAAALEVVYMGVVPPQRRRGVGALLLRRALERGRAAQARRLLLVVDDWNEPAKRLYARFGLHPVARR